VPVFATYFTPSGVRKGRRNANMEAGFSGSCCIMGLTPAILRTGFSTDPVFSNKKVLAIILSKVRGSLGCPLYPGYGIRSRRSYIFL